VSSPHRPTWPRRLVREESGFGAGFFTRTLLWFAVLAVVGHDVGQIIWTQVQVADAAHKGAQAGANMYYQSKNQARAEQAVVETISMTNKAVELGEFHVDNDGSVWTKTKEEATTFLFGRIGFLRGFTIRQATAHEDRSPF
jgi:hypothetical protein